MHHPDLKDEARTDDPGGVEAVGSLRRIVPRRALIAVAAAACACGVAAAALGSSGGERANGSATAAPARSAAARPAASDNASPPPLKAHPKAVQALAPGEAAPPSDGVTAGSGHVSGADAPPTDAEVRSELNEFRQHLTGVGVARGPVAQVRSNGTAVAPADAPDVVVQVIAAGNEIATKPYKWGGGHGAWRDSGYDCSGSVSFALAGAGLLNGPLTSGGFMHWGDSGRGRWITILANEGHVFMVVAGMRFDTSGAQGGTRWQPVNGRSYGGFEVRHPPGL